MRKKEHRCKKNNYKRVENRYMDEEVEIEIKIEKEQGLGEEEDISFYSPLLHLASFYMFYIVMSFIRSVYVYDYHELYEI